MLVYAIAFIGGILTIVSPCILPVLPLVFSRADRPFRKSGLPLLAGMALTFSVVALVATFAGSWVVRANSVGRLAAIVIFAVLGLALLFPGLGEFLSRPFVRLGGLVGNPGEAPVGIGRSLLLGVSTGLLWTPCAGPILGLILTGAAINGASTHSAFLLLAFALGAASSLALALLAGNKVFAMMKRSLGAEEWIRRGLGAAVLIGVAAIASGSETGILARLSLASTSGIEQGLIDRMRPVVHAQETDAQPAAMTANVKAETDVASVALANEGPMPSLDGAVSWLNSGKLTTEGLRGKVVLIDFWAHGANPARKRCRAIRSW